MSLNLVRNIQDGGERFEVWSNEDGSTWEIRKPTPSPGNPGYSAYGILGSGGDIDLTTQGETVVRNNEYVNNYNNSDLSLNTKNEVFEDLQGRSGFTNLANGSTSSISSTPPTNGDLRRG